MNVVIFGATGMIGHGVLLEALDSTAVTRVVSVGRRKTGIVHPKLHEIVHADFEDFTTIADQLTDLSACFWCLGVSSAGMDEATYTRITYTFTMAAAEVLRTQNPDMRFCFVSGAGTDDTEQGRAMWARVKGKAENALKRIGFREVIIFRPGFIRPLRGVHSRVTLYRVLYTILAPFDPLLKRLASITSTVALGHAMLAAGLGLAEQQVLDPPDINALASKLVAPSSST